MSARLLPGRATADTLLLFLKGDRMLEVRSSTDQAGAVRLATKVMGQL